MQHDPRPYASRAQAVGAMLAAGYGIDDISVRLCLPRSDVTTARSKIVPGTEQVQCALKFPDIAVLARAAEKRGITVAELSSRILAVVAGEISIDGLLDDGA